MRKSALVTVLFAFIAVFSFACGGTNIISPDVGPGTDGGLPDGSTPPADGGTTTCGSQLCASSQTCVQNTVCVTTPVKEAEAYVPKAWPPSKVTIDLTCFAGDPKPSPGPATVKIKACLSTFGIAQNTEDLEIIYYDYTGGKIGSQIGVTVTATTTKERDCPNQGYYEISDIPTNKLLVRKVSCASDDTQCKTKFHTTYQYNIYLDAGMAKDGVITDIDELDAEGNVVSDATWKLIANTVGISVASGHGVAAGRVRDCGRVNQVEYANVGTTTKPKRLVYFNGNEGKPKSEGSGTMSSDPDVGRTSTNVDGIYALIDLAPGDVFVQALAMSGGSVISVGDFTGQIFPDALTVLSFKGKRPADE